MRALDRRFLLFPLPTTPLADAPSTSRIDPKVAHDLAPESTAGDDAKGQYTIARFIAQNDHFVGFYKTWSKALNFLIGEQWRTKWDGTSLTWNVERDIPAWHQQPVTNLTYAVYRTAMAKLTKQKPTLEVVPKSGDSEDKEAGALSEAVLTYLWRQLKKPSKVPIALGWMLVTSCGWFRVGWDPEGGEVRPRTIPMERRRQPLGGPDGDVLGPTATEPVDDDALAAELPALPPEEIPEDDDFQNSQEKQEADSYDVEDVEVAADENGEPYKVKGSEDIDYDRTPDDEPIGEIAFDVVSPMCVRLNPEATSIEDATEMYVGTIWPRKKAAQHFGVKPEDLSSDEAAEQRALYEDLVSASAAGFPRSWADRSSVWGVSQQEAIGDRVLVIEYYARPCDEYKKGRHWITVGTKKVWPPTSKEQAEEAVKPAPDQPFPNGEAPLPFGFWPPLVPMLDTPIPGQPSGVPLLPQVVPLNEQLNVLDGKIAEKHVQDAMGGIWFASPEDEGIVITSEPGQVIFSKAMGRRGASYAPFQAQMHALPDRVYMEREVVTGKVMMVAGFSALDLSQKPNGMPSGRALLVTQETSDSVMMPTLFALETALEEVGRRELVIAQEKYREQRTIAIKGDNGQWLYRSFRNADLRNCHDVRVQVGSSFPWNKAAQWDTKIDVLSKVPQLVIKPDGSLDKAAFSKLMDSGTPGLGSFESDQDDDLLEIQREHAMFEAFDPESEEGSLQLPQIAFWQNHAVHLKEHYNFMKRSHARYLRWHPIAQEAFKEHMRLTLQAVEQLANQMLGPAEPTDVAGGDGEGGGTGDVPLPPASGSEPAEAPPLALVRPSAAPAPSGARLGRGDVDDAMRASGG